MIAEISLRHNWAHLDTGVGKEIKIYGCVSVLLRDVNYLHAGQFCTLLCRLMFLFFKIGFSTIFSGIPSGCQADSI